MKRKNYLNNKDLLKEIHKSKVSYCSYISEGDDQFDIILPNISRINIRTVAEAKRNQASRLAKQAYEEAVNAGQKVKQAEFEVNWKKIKKQELIFRIMTFDHIPLQPGRKKNPKTVADHHTQCNFPPFQHFKFNEEDKLICIGKSHWDGGMENGAFSKIHGKMTNELAKMYMSVMLHGQTGVVIHIMTKCAAMHYCNYLKLDYNLTKVRVKTHLHIIQRQLLTVLHEC